MLFTLCWTSWEVTTRNKLAVLVKMFLVSIKSTQCGCVTIFLQRINCLRRTTRSHATLGGRLRNWGFETVLYVSCKCSHSKRKYLTVNRHLFSVAFWLWCSMLPYIWVLSLLRFLGFNLENSNYVRDFNSKVACSSNLNKVHHRVQIFQSLHYVPERFWEMFAACRY